jgi:predicted amidohydrolase
MSARVPDGLSSGTLTDMDVALLQIEVDLDEPLPDRVERVAGLVREQDGADLVVLPELWPQGAFAYWTWADTAEPLDGPTVTALRQAARDLGARVHMGSLIERAPDGVLYNSSLLIGADGGVETTYRKIHRFGFDDGEPRLIGAGDQVVVHDGLGLATCYDLRFPELFRALLDGGAETFVLTSGWPAARIQHWTLLARARAVENQAYVVACNTAGQQGKVTLGGRSVVVDPWGEVVAEAGTREEVLRVKLDDALVARTRESFPVLRDRRLNSSL